MASKSRNIDTRFWSDTWIQNNLNPLDRYLFIYLLTNERSTWCGVYEIPLKFIANETGIDRDEIERSMLPRLAPKILYVDGWVVIKNFEKYHNNSSPTTQKGIEEAWKAVPERIRLKIKSLGENLYPIGGVSSLTSTFTSTSTPLGSIPSESTPKEKALNFFEVIREKTENYLSFVSKLTEQGLPQNIAESELQKFYDYWTELNSTGTKQRWEKEKTFEVHLRLKKWFSNVNKFKGTQFSKGRGMVEDLF